MRSAFVHEATIELAPDADEAAPGAAVTVGLCGHWEHGGACRWPHHTGVDQRVGRSIRVRVVFACAAGDEHVVRQQITDALSAGRLATPSGESRWKATSNGPATLRSSEATLAARLAAT